MKKSKVLLALTLLVGMPLLMYALSLVVEKRYTAQVRLQVFPTGQRFENQTPFGPIDDLTARTKPGNAATQVQVMTGTEVLGAAIQRARENLPNRLPSQESVSGAYESLVRRLQVDSDPLSDVVGLRVTQSDPEVAAEIANDIAYAYQEYVERTAKANGQSVLTALTTQANTMKARLDRLDAQIADLKSKAKVADAAASASVATSAASANQQQLDQAQSQYEGAVAELNEAKRLLKTIPPTILASSTTQPNPVPIGIEQDLARLRTQYAELRSRYTDNHPDVKALTQQIQQAESQLRKYKQSMNSGTSTQPNPAYQTQYSNVVSLQGKVDGFRSSLASLKAASGAIQAKVNDLPALQQQIDGLDRERQNLSSSYIQLTTRRDATAAANASRQPSVTIVSPALVPESPSFPDARLFILAGLAVGGFLAILLLMPRQEAPLVPNYYPAVYDAPTAAPVAGATREPVGATTGAESASLDAGERRDG